MSPPFVVTHAELDEMFARTTRALDRLWAGEVAKA
jgi:hypothetical protein